jgi:hypothetical protein
LLGLGHGVRSASNAGKAHPAGGQLG